MTKADRVLSTPPTNTSLASLIEAAKSCPALAVARSIDGDDRLRNDMEKCKYARKDDKDVWRVLDHADTQLCHMQEARLRMLAVTPATSFAGAIAKMVIGFSMLHSEIDSPHENEFQQEHFKWMARAMMADARRILEPAIGQFADIGTKYWYSGHLEMSYSLDEAQRILASSRSAKGGSDAAA